MAKLLRIERAVAWIARAFVANRDPNPTMAEVYDVISPTVDVFGSDRLGQVFIETILGGLGALEIVQLQAAVGTPVQTALTRHYLSVEVTHDDPIDRQLRIGRIIPTAAGFPFGGATASAAALAAGFAIAARNLVLGPSHLMAARANGMGAGAQMTMTVVWMQYPPGEYLTGVS